MEVPGRILLNQFFCLERNRLVHLMIKEDLIPMIPPWDWSDHLHKVLQVLVEPSDHPAADGNICWIHWDMWDLRHSEYVSATREWAIGRHQENPQWRLRQDLDRSLRERRLRLDQGSSNRN